MALLLKFFQELMVWFIFHKFHTNVSKIQRMFFQSVKMLLSKFLMLILLMNVSHFPSKRLKNVQLRMKATEKNVNLVLVVKNVKINVTTNFQKLKLDSQWLTCLVILNYNL